MELSRFTDYSVRFLIFAGLHPNEWISVPEVAKAYGVSCHHLVKVAQNLSRLGYITAKRGRAGGFQLAVEPKDINIGKVVRETESLDIVECFQEGNCCAINGACLLKKAIAEARTAFLGALNKYTLEDFLKNPQALAQRFQSASPISES